MSGSKYQNEGGHKSALTARGVRTAVVVLAVLAAAALHGPAPRQSTVSLQSPAARRHACMPESPGRCDGAVLSGGREEERGAARTERAAPPAAPRDASGRAGAAADERARETMDSGDRGGASGPAARKPAGAKGPPPARDLDEIRKRTGTAALERALDRGVEFDKNSFIVAFRRDAPAEIDREAVHAQIDARRRHSYRRIPADVVEMPPDRCMAEVFRAYEAHDDVEYVEPNYVLELLNLPDDEHFHKQWALRNEGQDGGTPGADIDAPGAWAINTGDGEVIVAVIDTGIDYNHPDLAANMWVNPDPDPELNDIHGARWTEGDGEPVSGDPMDDNGHGTHVAGVIGAIGNNQIGVAGLNWNVRLMALKFLNSRGRGKTADAVAAVEYAIEHGAHLSNNSWGGEQSQSLMDIIEDAGVANQLFVVAAGNKGNNNDDDPVYPASYGLPNIIAVASSNRHDVRSSFSNYGADSVHLAAPGSDIYSTLPLGEGEYGDKSGTSMAAPHVAGVAALLLSDQPATPYDDIKRQIMDSVCVLVHWEDQVISGGRLNAARALRTGRIMIAVHAGPEDAVAGRPLEGPPSVIVTDLNESPVENVTVTVSEADGYVFDGGAVQAFSGADGIARFDDIVINKAGLFALVFDVDAVYVDPLISETFEVAPAEVHMVALSPGDDLAVAAGETVVFSASAFDSFDNLVTGDAGDFAWTGAGADGLFDMTEAGVWTVTASHGDVISDAVSVTVGPAEVENVAIEPAEDMLLAAGGSVAFFASAFDRFDNLVTGDAGDFAWTGAGAGGLFDRTEAGVWTVTASLDGVVSNAVNVTVEAVDVESVVIQPSGAQTLAAGSVIDFSAAAYDPYNNLVTGYAGDFAWAGAGPGGLFDQTAAGLYDVTAAYGGVQSDAVPVTVEPAGVTAVYIQPSGAQTVAAGSVIDFSAAAYDPYNNLVTGDAGDFAWTGAGPGGLFDQTEAGFWEVTAAREGVTSPPAGVTVEPADADVIVFDPIDGRIAGASFTVALAACDPYGNIAGGYDGTVQLADSTGTLRKPGDGLPLLVEFEAGLWSGDAVITRAAEGVSVTAADVEEGGPAGESSVFDVAAAEYVLVVTVEGEGSVTVDGENYVSPLACLVDDVEEGVELVLEAVAAVEPFEWIFSGWEDGSPSPGRVINIDLSTIDTPTPAGGEKNVTATFVTYIQNEINSAAADPGRNVVEVPPGSYAACRPIVFGEGAGGLTLRSTGGANAAFISAGGGAEAIIIEADDVILEGFWLLDFMETGVRIEGHNAQILDMIIDGDGPPGAGAQGILIADGRNAFIAGNRIEDCTVGISLGMPAEGTVIANNTFTRNETAVAGLTGGGGPPADARLINNNIHDNGLGVSWPAGPDGPRLGAAWNWWGSGDGPQHPGNPDGTGDMITGDVDYVPFLGSETAASGRGAMARDGELKADVPAGFAVLPDGAAAFVTGRSAVPDGTPGHSGAGRYAELRIVEDFGAERIVLAFGYREPDEMEIYWFDRELQNWRQCSKEIVDRDPETGPFAPPGPFEAGDYDGLVTVSIDSDKATRPHLGDFSSLQFAVAGRASRKSSGGGGGGGSGCFIAAAAYGGPMSPELDALRAFRDDVLMSTEAGERLVRVYYRIAPPLAVLISRNETARRLVRKALNPLAGR